MYTSTILIGILSITIYLVALVLSIRCATFKNQTKWYVISTAAIALILHFIVLWSLVVLHWVNLGFYHAISFASAFLVLLVLLTHRWYKVSNIMVVALPIVVLSLTLELIHPEPVTVTYQAGMALDSHILLSLVTYSFLAIGAILAATSYLQEYLLKTKKLTGILQSMPPLFEVEKILFKVIFIGFVLLTSSLLSGFLFLEDVFAKTLLHKTFFSLLSWLVFATLLLGHFFYGWRGSLATKLSLIGFGLVIMAYFGSKAVLELFL